MERVLLDEVIETDYGQFDLTWDQDSGGFDGDFDRFFTGQVNGLVGAADPSGVYLNLARRSGGSPVRIVLCDAPPDDDPSYQDVVEVSVGIPLAARVRWQSWAAESSDALPELRPGSYRCLLRSSQRNAKKPHTGGR